MENTNYEEYKRDKDWRQLFITMRGKELKKEISFLSRKQIISWLEWEDPDGVYSDADSRREFGSVMSRKEGVEIMTRHIEEEYINSYGRLLANTVHEFFEKQINS